MKSVLSIAGSDSSGGAGIQADIKTIESLGLFAQTAITALTAQNTTGVYGVYNVSPEFVSQQIDVVFDDIVPDAVKIGMVSSPEIVEAIAEALIRVNARHIVLDPVMVATSGSSLIVDDAVEALITKLMPLAEVATPNYSEACALSGITIETEDDMVAAGKAICAFGASYTLVKGGHAQGNPDDVLVDATGNTVWLRAKRIDTANTHGTGCTLSSAIACGLAQGKRVEEAAQYAKEYISGALADGLDLGRGSGPLNHMWQHSF